MELLDNIKRTPKTDRLYHLARLDGVKESVPPGAKSKVSHSLRHMHEITASIMLNEFEN